MTYEEELLSKIENKNLIQVALASFIRNGDANTTQLQKDLQIGYAQAAFIIDYCEEMGYIGPNMGREKPRKVNITIQQFIELFLTNKKEEN